MRPGEHHRAAVRRDRVAPDGDDERRRARRGRRELARGSSGGPADRARGRAGRRRRMVGRGARGAGQRDTNFTPDAWKSVSFQFRRAAVAGAAAANARRARSRDEENRMYAQMVDTGVKAVRDGRRDVGRGAGVPGAHRRRHQDRAEGLDAGRLPEDADPADLAARAFRDRRHAAGRQLDHPRADAEAQGDPDGQGAGRGRPRPLSLLGRGDARRVARPDGRRPARRPRQVLVDLQLPDAHLGRHRRDRLARRRRGDHEPDSAVPLLVRAVRAGDGAHLQGGELPPAAGLRHHARARAAARRSRRRWRRTRSTAGGGRR